MAAGFNASPSALVQIDKAGGLFGALALLRITAALAAAVRIEADHDGALAKHLAAK